MSGWASGWVRGRDLAIDLGTANTVIYERGRGVVLDEPSVVAVRAGTSQLAGGRPPRQGDARPHPGVGHRGAPAARRGHLRRRRHRADDPLVRRAGLALAADPAPGRGVRAQRHHQRRAPGPRGRHPALRRPAGLRHRGDDGGRDRRRAARRGDPRLDGRRRRGRHDRRRRSSASAASSPRARCASAATRSTTPSSPTSRASTPCCWGSAAPRTSRSAPARPSRCARSSPSGCAAATSSPGCPRRSSIGSAEVRRAIETPIVQIVELVRTVLDVCPPELAGDVVDRGIALTGGGALIRGLDERLSHELGRAGARRRRPPARGRPRRRPVRRGVQHARARARRQPAPLTMHVRRTPTGRGRAVDGHAPGHLGPFAPPPRRRRSWSPASSWPLGVSGAAALEPVRGAAAAVLGPLERLLGPGDDEVSAARAEQAALATRLAAAQREVAAAAPSPASSRARPSPGARLVPARVVAVGASGPAGPERVTIDAGSRDGVEVDRTVVAAEGLVGRVVSVAPWTSDVLLVGSPDLTVGVRVGPRGVLGEASGRGPGRRRPPRPRAALLRPRRPGRAPPPGTSSPPSAASATVRSCRASRSARWPPCTWASAGWPRPGRSPRPSTRRRSTSSPWCSPRGAAHPAPGRDGHRVSARVARCCAGLAVLVAVLLVRHPRRAPRRPSCPTSCSCSSSPGRCCAARWPARPSASPPGGCSTSCRPAPPTSACRR